MNLNTKSKLVVNYRPCVKCNKRLSKVGNIYCKGCKPKKEYNRTLSKNLREIYLSKFDINNPSHGNEHAKVANMPGSKLTYSRFRLNKEISLQNNTKTPTIFLHFSTLYFMYNSVTIQQNPKYQQFVSSKEDQLPAILSTIQLIPVPTSRPLLLLAQESYWDDLITSYFKHIHPILPIFSIHSFNPKTAAKPLMSAVYYGGFQFMQNKPPELVKYFNEYAERNIKEATRTISLQNAQATLIYSFMMVFSGNFKLFRALQTHTIRMSYALGLHLNLKWLTSIQRYDRMRFFLSICPVHMFFYGIGSLSLIQLIEIGDFNTELVDSNYQIPNSKSVFSLDTKDENIVYGICVDIRFALSCMQSQHIFNLRKCTKHTIQSEFDMLFASFTQKYAEYMSIYDSILQKYQHLKLNIQIQRINSIIAYHIGNLEMYSVLRYKVDKLNSSDVSNMLDECVILFNTIIESQEFCQLRHTYPYLAGLNFIKIYQIANTSEKSLIRRNLGKLIDYLSKGPIKDKLTYLIIKKEYELILKSK
ncbi:hypothetical protein CONCODRAFT_19798 [Conidiobolus coronatus NRRL 28638]|uniref:Xylanolytic transcriptional activator regulatory domain-containing protein n=1 Tax=Conidiobolus coronatus (strain ATCC 28846 / CBS 209.66 / NRRL 28638) TaxID=796925 RepID=A0A137NWX9_CONC2|nr:hypothetical protein CONCODRAFT_19798 [Conidiobolus coronatus NRRL 28638]|eukprot:KXN67181.1 hypothetical protein CONCODRAFT_19798 [Conidiobolus coronatus NRRL 28638]